MNRYEQAGTSVLHQTYYERRTPSADAASIGRWVVTPSVLAAFLGGLLFAGIGLAGTDAPTFRFVAGMFMFGSGLVGICMLILRVATFDRTGNVTVNQSTPVQMETPARPAQVIGGNRPVMVPTNEPHIVESGGRSYSFSVTQLRLMIDRVEDDNTAVARDAFQIESASYPAVKAIMSDLGHWRVERTGVEWTPEGIEWLRGRMRLVNA